MPLLLFKKNLLTASPLAHLVPYSKPWEMHLRDFVLAAYLLVPPARNFTKR